jgi:hypothetical protein
LPAGALTEIVIVAGMFSVRINVMAY